MAHCFWLVIFICSVRLSIFIAKRLRVIYRCIGSYRQIYKCTAAVTHTYVYTIRSIATNRMKTTKMSRLIKEEKKRQTKNSNERVSKQKKESVKRNDKHSIRHRTKENVFFIQHYRYIIVCYLRSIELFSMHFSIIHLFGTQNLWLHFVTMTMLDKRL